MTLPPLGSRWLSRSTTATFTVESHGPQGCWVSCSPDNALFFVQPIVFVPEMFGDYLVPLPPLRTGFMSAKERSCA